MNRDTRAGNFKGRAATLFSTPALALAAGARDFGFLVFETSGYAAAE